MSITITIGIKKIAINNQTYPVNLNGIINELTKLTIKGCELKVFILDMNTTNFHTYVFEYLQESKLSPRKWLLNNIIYSITCNETKDNLFTVFINFCFLKVLHILLMILCYNIFIFQFFYCLHLRVSYRLFYKKHQFIILN
jgi:hypothetical protein